MENKTSRLAIEYPSHEFPTEGVEYYDKEVDYNDISFLSFDGDKKKETEFNELGYTEWILPLGVHVYLRPNQSSIYMDELNIHWKLKNFPHQTA